jgi:hypothetical protein
MSTTGRAPQMPIPSTNKLNNFTIRLLFALVWLFSSLSVGAANAGPTSSSSLTTLTNSDTAAIRAKEDQIIARYEDSPGGKIDDWRRDLPPELRSERGAPLHRIEMDGVVIYLLGTSHVSRASCDDARLLMQHIRPGEKLRGYSSSFAFYFVHIAANGRFPQMRFSSNCAHSELVCY